MIISKLLVILALFACGSDVLISLMSYHKYHIEKCIKLFANVCLNILLEKIRIIRNDWDVVEYLSYCTQALLFIV